MCPSTETFTSSSFIPGSSAKKVKFLSVSLTSIFGDQINSSAGRSPNIWPIILSNRSNGRSRSPNQGVIIVFLLALATDLVSMAVLVWESIVERSVLQVAVWESLQAMSCDSMTNTRPLARPHFGANCSSKDVPEYCRIGGHKLVNYGPPVF